MDKSILEQVSVVTELNDISKFLNDPDVDQALGKLVKLIAISSEDRILDSPAQSIIRLQALACSFHLRASAFAYIIKPESKSDDAKRKSMYYALASEIDKLVAALKYVNRG